jgi:hypothetical protein
LTDEPEEKPAVSPEMVSSAADSTAEENLDNKEGWRIAREALLREVVRYGGQGALVLALLGAIGYAGYWSLSEMKSLPAFVQRIAQPFIPPPAVAPGQRITGGAADSKVAEVKAPVKVPVKKRSHRSRNTQIASKFGRRPYYAPTSDDPTNGRIIYSDGMITQYSWNK